MLVKGYWAEFWDGAIRPLVQAEVELPGGGWQEVRFLLDGGADRTVLEARLLPLLAPLLLPEETDSQLSGIGGHATTRSLHTRLSFTRDDGKRVTVNGTFAIFTSAENSDLSILGRDVTDNFDVIYSFPRREVLLLAQPHGYVVQLPF